MTRTTSFRLRDVQASRRPLVIALVLGVLTADAAAQVATEDVYGCQNNRLYEPSPLMQNDHFGSSICFEGDFNGDGFNDLVIGGYNDATKNVPPGQDFSLSRAAVYLGSPTGMASTPVLVINGNGTRDQLGLEVLFLKDVNGDGKDELLVTAPNFPNQFDRTGRGYILLGRELAAPLTLSAGSCADIILQGDRPGGRFGDSVVTTALLDTDGATDFIIGAPGSKFTDGTNYPGSAYVFLGSGNLASALSAATLNVNCPQPGLPLVLRASDADVVLSGDVDADRFGQALAIIGNINGAAGVEFAVGAPQTKLDSGLPRGMTGPGYVRVFNYLSTSTFFVGQLDGEQGSEDHSQGEAFGIALAGGVDIGGDLVSDGPDGINDLVVGAILHDIGTRGSGPVVLDAGAVHVFSGFDFSRLLPGADPDGPGPDEAEVTRLFGEDNTYWYGWSIATVTNIVGSFFPAIPDIVVGSIRYGTGTAVNVPCGPIPEPMDPNQSQGGQVAGAVYVIDGATPDGKAHFRIIGERFKDSLGFAVAAGPFDQNGIAIVSGGPRWANPLFEECDPPLIEPQCPTETGRVYVYYADALNMIE